MHARLILEAGESHPPRARPEPPPRRPTIGRARGQTPIVVKSDLVSRLHAKVYYDAGKWVVRDFGMNGTRVDNRRVAGAADLADGAMIQLAEVRFRFVSGTSAAAHTPLPTPAVVHRTPAPAGAGLAPAAFQKTPGRNDTVGTKVHDFVLRQKPDDDDGPADAPGLAIGRAPEGRRTGPLSAGS